MEPRQYKPKLGWQDSPAWGVFLIIVYGIAAVMPVIITILAAPPIDDPLLIKTALVGAMIGFTLLCMQVFLAGRFRHLDRPFGLDMVMRFHKRMAIFALVILLLHPVLIALGHKSWGLFGFDTSWKVNLGKAALVFLVLGVLFSLSFSKLKIDYNVWRFFHKSMIFIIILAFFHGIVIGPHIRNSQAIRVFWYTIFIAALAVYCFRNFVMPFIRAKYLVEDIHQETHDTYTVLLKPVSGKSMVRNPGQFMFLRLIRPGRKTETHPFTISASPLRDDILQATIKKSGNFTDTIDRTRKGDTARIEAPFGRFSFVHHKSDKLLFIIGGVGITPALSMIRLLRDTAKDCRVTLLYANNGVEDIICRKELDELPDNFKTVHILKNPPEDWSGEKGYIDSRIIEKHAPDMINDADIYLCGPPPMMDAMIEVLHQLNVDDRRIHFERFTI